MNKVVEDKTKLLLLEFLWFSHLTTSPGEDGGLLFLLLPVGQALVLHLQHLLHLTLLLHLATLSFPYLLVGLLWLVGRWVV